MRFIELHELYYRNGSYWTKPFLCNINEIAIVTESTEKYIDATIVTMKNKNSYRVKDKYKDVISMIVQASAEGRENEEN